MQNGSGLQSDIRHCLPMLFLFETDKFSDYAIAYKDVKMADTNTENGKGSAPTVDTANSKGFAPTGDATNFARKRRL